MAAPTDTSLRQLVDDIPTAQDTSSFISTAILLTDEVLANKGLSTNRLDVIKLYLAAHFAIITVERGGLIESRVGESSDRYAKPTTKIETGGIGSTRYGQQAIALDSSGTLAVLGSGAKKARCKLVLGGNGNWDATLGTYYP